MDHRTERFDECGFVVGPGRCDSDADTDDCSFFIVSIDVHEMEFGSTAAAIDQMLRGGVNMPPDVEYLLIVEFKMREALNLSLGVVRCPGRGELPVEEVTRDCFVLISREIRDMESGRL